MSGQYRITTYDGQLVEEGTTAYKSEHGFWEHCIYRATKKNAHIKEYHDKGFIIEYLHDNGYKAVYTRGKSLHLDHWGNSLRTDPSYIEGVQLVYQTLMTTPYSKVSINFDFIGHTKSEMHANMMHKEILGLGLTGWTFSTGYRQESVFKRVLPHVGDW